METLSEKEAIAKLRLLLSEIRPGLWCNSEMVRKDGERYASHDEVVEALRQSVLKGSLRFYGVTLDTEDELTLWDHLTEKSESALWVCHTGNGPTSKTHAEFIACVKEWLPGILDALETARSEKVALLRHIDTVLNRAYEERLIGSELLHELDHRLNGGTDRSL